MSSPQLPPTAIPKPLAEDDDDVSWALQTAAVQWGRGAYQDALVWLRRAAESAIELNAWSRGADLNASAARIEKLVAQAMAQGLSPSSIPVGAPSVRPSAPAQQRPSFPAPLSVGPTAPAPSIERRVTTGYSSFPSNQSSRPPSSPRNSVVIDDVQEAELELSDDELRQLEAETGASDIPNGYRPSAFAGSARQQPVSFPAPHAESLPAFPLEPSRPIYEHPSRPSQPGGLPAFPLEPSNRPPPASARPQVSARPAMPDALPSFPLETGASSLPPVSRWPVHGRPGTSQLPQPPGLPVFEAVRPSRPFENDGDDGTPGLDDDFTRQMESQRPPSRERVEPVARGLVSSIPEDVSDDELIEEIEVQEAEEAPIELPPVPEARPKPSSLPRLPIRPTAAASHRPRPATTPLPPATASARPWADAKIREPRLPSRIPLEPRLPSRLPSVPTPSPARVMADEGRSEDFGASSRYPSRPPLSNAPTERKLEILGNEPRSVPPPSARGIEPQDLPTVSSPSLSQPPPPMASEAPASRAPSGFPRYETAYETPSPLTPATGPVSVHPALPQIAAAEPNETAPEEPLVELPPVVQSSPAEQGAATSNAELYGVRLADVRGFSDLPASALDKLVTQAKIERLEAGEEASFFSVALVLEGWVSLMPAIAESACATAVVGEVVFTEGTLDNGLMLRVVAGQDHVVVATWDSAAIAEATIACPWIADDLKLLADGFQALAGACLGPLGDRLDDSLRSIVTSRCEIRTLLPGEQLCAAKKPVPGMHIVGGGEVELVDENGRVVKTHGTGEFLFATQVLAGGGAPFMARAGSHGALVLFAPRMSAHELLVSVAPLLEILAE